MIISFGENKVEEGWVHVLLHFLTAHTQTVKRKLFFLSNMGALNILLGYIGRGIAVLGASFSVGGNRPTDWG
jgi:hypothetical protein